MTEEKLTHAQLLMLAQAIASGTIVVNGRRMAAAEKLEKLGLVKTKTWIEGSSDGGRWQVRVTPTDKGSLRFK
jgi:hypothetical protein